MRFSTLFGRTLRDAPADAIAPALRLALRAALARQILAGGFALLPLGLRAVRRIETIIREELDAIDAQELRMPVVQPAELWRASGRYDQYGPLMLRVSDHGGRDLVLAPTHEELVTELARREISSYRQLPALVYQIGPKLRDELRTRGGLLRLREFTMMDAYSFSADAAGLDAVFEQVRGAYERLLARCGIEFVAVQASSGQMGGGESVEFLAPSEHGEDVLVRCTSCGYAANSEVAVAAYPTRLPGAEQQLQRIATPETKTIADLAHLLGLPRAATAKAVFFWEQGRGLIFAVIRGDLDVSAAKLAILLGSEELRPATAEEIAAIGAVPGYASPIGLSGATVVADKSVVGAGALVAGANEEGYHLTGVTYGRDWRADYEADIADVRQGDPCVRCGTPLSLERGIEIGHIFKLGTRYSDALGATFLDEQGQTQPLIMGCYGIGLERLLHVIIEQHHDEQGMIWPEAVAPAAVHLLALGKGSEPARVADDLAAQLQRAGVSFLYDDRQESAGVKLNDADLIGLPLRLVVGERLLREGQVELRQRRSGETQTLALETCVETIRELVGGR